MDTTLIDFFTSDLHFGHVNMRAWRGMADTHSMDEFNDVIVDRFNSVVGSCDTVAILGDICMGLMDDSLPLVERLNGRKLLLAGNHDRNWAGNPKRVTETHDWPHKYQEVGLFPLEPGMYNVYDLPGLVNLDHFPYSGDHTAEARFPEWRPVDDGKWLLHGHVHDMWLQNGRQINVGVDAWNGFPVSTRTLAAVMAGGEANVAADDSWGIDLTRPVSL